MNVETLNSGINQYSHLMCYYCIDKDANKKCITVKHINKP